MQNHGQRPLAIGAGPQWLMNRIVVLSYVVQSREGLVTFAGGHDKFHSLPNQPHWNGVGMTENQPHWKKISGKMRDLDKITPHR